MLPFAMTVDFKVEGYENLRCYYRPRCCRVSTYCVRSWRARSVCDS